MNSPKVSVIIPVYNVERYLRRCLDSVIEQTLKDIEIICVDDGSTDGSPFILYEYAQKDERIIVLDRENSGAGGARNQGLKIARGQYISFLDADDFFEPNMYEEAYNRCINVDADFCVFKADLYNDAAKRFEPCAWALNEELLPAKNPFCYLDILKDVFRLFNGWAWDKLYKRSFVRFCNLHFQEIRTTNDLCFVYSALVKAKRITTLDRILAHHRVNHADSLSQTREKSWNCFYLALLALRAELVSMDIYKYVEQSYIDYALHFSLWNLNTIAGATHGLLQNKLKNEYFKELGIVNRPKSYFYSQGEYLQYSAITKASFDFYLYKIVRGITFISRKCQRFSFISTFDDLKVTLHKTRIGLFRLIGRA